MKYFIISILLLGSLVTCSTIDRECISENELLKTELINLRDSVNKIVPDTVFLTSHFTDTIKIDTEGGFKAKLQVERIKHYVNISEARPANKKFFFGWVKRTVSE